MVIVLPKRQRGRFVPAPIALSPKVKFGFGRYKRI